jgi:hypothetical protein
MTEKYRRVQFDFAPESIDELESLESALRLKTKAQVIRYALQVLQWMVDQAKAGNSVLVEKNDRLQEVLFPFLSPVTRERTAHQDSAQKADEGREYATRKARELRERADELIQRSKAVAERREDSMIGAIEAAREAAKRKREL